MRPFSLGLSDSLYAISNDGLTFAYQTISRDADMIVLQWDDGVPWPEALAGAPYASGFQAEIARKRAGIPQGHQVYVALNAISFIRNGLALYKSDSGNRPLPDPWQRLSFDHPLVVEAFVNHCERMIATLRPTYFAYALEANMLLYFNPDSFPAFLRMAAAVYPRLKASHPSLPIFVTLSTDTFHTGGPSQPEAVRQLLQYSDVIAATAYPFNDEHDPRLLRPDYYAALRNVATQKPFAVAETCWPAENVMAPYPTPIPASDETQRLYLERLLSDADALRARFVVWFYARDYDDIWNNNLSLQPGTEILLAWKDCGLYAGDGRARPSLTLWRQWLARLQAN